MKIRLKVGETRIEPTTPMAEVTMRFKPANELPTPHVELSSSNGKVTILNAAEWSFYVPKQVVTGLTKGKWNWQINVTDTSTDGAPLTYLAGEVEILEKI